VPIARDAPDEIADDFGAAEVSENFTGFSRKSLKSVGKPYTLITAVGFAY